MIGLMDGKILVPPLRYISTHQVVNRTQFMLILDNEKILNPFFGSNLLSWWMGPLQAQ